MEEEILTNIFMPTFNQLTRSPSKFIVQSTGENTLAYVYDNVIK